MQDKNNGKKSVASFGAFKENFKKFLAKEFFRNALIQWLEIFTLFFNMTGWLVLLYFIRKIDFPIVLHYNVYFGVDVIGSWWQAYFLPLVGLMIIAVNNLLAYYIYSKKERIACYILLLAAAGVQLGILISLTAVVLVNYY